MTYERIKRIKGREYRYLVKGIRVNGKVKQKVVKYLGPVDPVQKKRRGGGRKPSVFAREPTPHERQMLLRKKRSPKVFERERALIILHSANGMDVKTICEKISREQRMVRRAIHDFNEKGLKALVQKKAKGAEPKFTKEQRARILEAVMTDPRKLGLSFTTWSLPKLKAYLIETGAVDSISIETIRTILHSQGVKLVRSKRWQYSNDPDFL
ncbi:MAG: transposase, partial [Candidatus Hydrothermarchaeales archaeon]